MNVRSPFITNSQPSELVKPRKGALDHPSIDTQPTAMLFTAPRQNGLDVAGAKLFTMRLGIIRSIALHAIGTMPGTSSLASKRWNAIHKLQQLSNIMIVRPCKSKSQRHTFRIGDHMMLTAWFAAVSGIRPSFFPRRQEPEPMRNLLQRVTSRSFQLDADALREGGESSPTRLPDATREAVSSTSCHSHSLTPGVASPREFPRPARKESPSVLDDRRCVFCPDSDTVGVWEEEGVAESTSINRRREAVLPLELDLHHEQEFELELNT